ncbi:MAG: hypothetical protein ACI9AQ_002793, partial [Dinoroseobacter sp.]
LLIWILFAECFAGVQSFLNRRALNYSQVVAIAIFRKARIQYCGALRNLAPFCGASRLNTLIYASLRCLSMGAQRQQNCNRENESRT